MLNRSKVALAAIVLTLPIAACGEQSVEGEANSVVETAGAASPSSATVTAKATKATAPQAVTPRGTATKTQHTEAVKPQRDKLKATTRRSTDRQTEKSPDEGVTSQEEQLFGAMGGAGSPESRREELRHQGWKQNSTGTWYLPGASEKQWRQEALDGRRYARGDLTDEEKRIWDTYGMTMKEYEQSWRNAKKAMKKKSKKTKASEKKFCEDNGAWWHDDYGCIAD